MRRVRPARYLLCQKLTNCPFNRVLVTGNALRPVAETASNRVAASKSLGQHARVTWTAPEVTRTDPPNVADERAALQGWLDFHRATLRWKCAGLTGEQLVRRPVASSTLSLLGLVRHMAEVERAWFLERFAGQSDLAELFCTEDYPDGDLDLTDAANAAEDFARYIAECAAADDAARGHLLDETFTRSNGVTQDLRWIYLHMIEEYARHNGHADLIRELIDGATGD
jgi:uncharacterized damage-inducible protein DinB